jgi:hypothetical protein
LQAVSLVHDSQVVSAPVRDDQGAAFDALFTVVEPLATGYVPMPGNSRTALADRIAPPRRRSYARCVALALLALVSFQGLHAIGIVIGLAMGALSCVAFLRTSTYNKTEWESQIERWRRLFICKACGQVIDPW